MTGNKYTTAEYHKAYNDYYPLMLNILYSRLQNTELAEDLCQEVFTNFFIHFDKIEPEKRRSWLSTTLRFTLSNYHRKIKNIHIDLDEFSDIFADRSEDTDSKDINIILEDAFENMENFANDTEKALFDLVAIYEYSYKETAKILGLSKRQVEYKYNQISKRIIEYLKKKNISGIEDIL